MRYTGPKAKKARRLNFAFTDKDVKILQKRGFPPGQHGQGRSRLSEYGTQLREKQKAKILYGVQEKQFFKYFNQAHTKPGVTGDNLINILEKRLDNIVFRLGFAATRAQARQLVSHGFFAVNGKAVNIPSYITKVGEIVTVKENKKQSKYIQTAKERMKNARPLDFVDFNPTTMTGKILTEPTPEQVGNQINTQLIVEHYSRI